MFLQWTSIGWKPMEGRKGKVPGHTVGVVGLKSLKSNSLTNGFFCREGRETISPGQRTESVLFRYGFHWILDLVYMKRICRFIVIHTFTVRSSPPFPLFPFIYPSYLMIRTHSTWCLSGKEPFAMIWCSSSLQSTTDGFLPKGSVGVL